MNLLAIDSASSFLSVAVSRENEIFGEDIEAGMKHSELVMDLIENQMKKASLSPRDLNGVICMGGPGSFTGLRIGYSIAKGLALSLSKPFAPIPTLECIALSCAGKLIMPIIQARKGAYFFTIFRAGERLLPDADADEKQIAEIIGKQNEEVTLTGPGAEDLFEKLPQEIKTKVGLNFERRGFAKELIEIALKKDIFANDNSAYLFSGPEYIRKTDAELKGTSHLG